MEGIQGWDSMSEDRSSGVQGRILAFTFELGMTGKKRNPRGGSRF